MKFGIGSYALTWSIGVPGNLPDQPLTPYDLIDKAADLKVDCIQIDDNMPLDSFSDDELDDIVDYSRQKKVGVEVGTRGFTRKKTLQYLSIAEKFGSPFLRMVFDEGTFKPSREEIVKTIREVIPEFEKKDICLAIENHDRFKAETFRDIIEASGSRYVKICLDSVNSFGAGEGLATIIDTLAPYTINLHLKEFVVKRVWHMMGFTIEGMPLGKGMLPVQYLVDRVKGNCISATLELWTSPEDQIGETVKKEEQWVEESIRYWRNNIVL